MSDRLLPMIDLGAALNSPGGEAALADEVGRAARGPGFFYLTGHTVDRALMADVFAKSAVFFALAPAQKTQLSITHSPHNRGYVELGGETLDPGHPPDLKEAFNIGLDLAATDPRVLAGEPFRGVNLWPDLPRWRETMLSYFAAVWSLGRVLHRAVAIDLGMEPDFFEDKLDQPMATLRLLHYPPQPPSTAPGQMGAGAHTDYGNITLLMTDEVGGLEVRSGDGTWLKAPPVKDAFICNIGDCLMRWSNDVYASTPHRVVNSSGRERYSVAFFLDPNPDALVSCLPSCITRDRPARYPPVSGADYLTERLNQTYAFRGPA